MGTVLKVVCRFWSSEGLRRRAGSARREIRRVKPALRVARSGVAWKLGAFLFYLAMSIVGCGGPEATTQPAQAPEPRGPRIEAKPAERADAFVEAGAMPGRTHLVQAKETLYGLAQRYYGSTNQWRRIYYANRNRLADPNNLPVGVRLIIP